LVATSKKLIEPPSGERIMLHHLSSDKEGSIKPEQLPKEFYFKKYADITSFISYFYQINSVIDAKANTVLEVGIGNRIVSTYLRQSGYKVTTFDINKALEPDVVGDIRNLPFKNNMFDVVLACEILEHLSFGDVPRSVSELRRVSRKKVVLSIPYSCFFVENVLNIKTPVFQKQLRFGLSFPFFTSEFKRTGEHYWEMGRKNFQRKEIRRLLEKYFKIASEFQPILNPYHYFFILEKTAD